MTARYIISGSDLRDVTYGLDGSTWAADFNGAVWRITTGGITTKFTLSGSHCTGIVQGFFSSISLWVADASGNLIQLDIFGSLLNTFPFAGVPNSILEAGDSNLYLGDSTNNKVWQITPSGVATGISTSTNPPTDVAIGSDFNLWASSSTGKMLLVGTSGGMTVTPFSVSANSLNGICQGPDGNNWLCDSAGVVWKVNTSGTTLASYTIAAGHLLAGITTGADGNLWVTDQTDGSVWQVTTSGAATEVLLPGSVPTRSVANQSDNNLWVADKGEIWKVVGTSPYVDQNIPWLKLRVPELTYPQWEPIPPYRCFFIILTMSIMNSIDVNDFLTVDSGNLDSSRFRR